MGREYNFSAHISSLSTGPILDSTTFSLSMRARRDSGNLPNGRSRGKRRGRRPKRSKDEKGGRTVNTAAPALFAFMGPLSSSGSLSVWRWACAALRCGNGWFRNGQRKAIIRTHHRLEIGSDYIGLVRLKGLEPTRIAEREPKGVVTSVI